MRAIFIITAIVALYIAPGHAQPARILDNPELTRDLLEALISLQDTVIEKAERGRIEDELDSLRPGIREDLIWSGQNGYLLQVRAFVDAQGRVQTLSGPSSCGSAMTPSDALTLCLANGVIQQDVVEGLKFSASNSYFIWATKKKGFLGFGKDRVKFGVIPGDLSGRLWQNTATLLASEQVVAEMRESRNQEAIRHAVERLKARMRNSQQEAVLAGVYQKMREQKERVREIDQELNDQLTKIARANAMIAEINMLQGILGVAQTVARVKSVLATSDNTSTLDTLNTIPAVKDWLSAYSSSMTSNYESLKQQQTLAEQEAHAAREQVRRVLDDHQVPGTFLY